MSQPAGVEAVIFDTDGVVTQTAVIHLTAWARLFDDFLARAQPDGVPFDPFTSDDYRRFVDGMPRYDGVARFLESRGISLPRGEPGDDPGDATICALGNRKNDYFLDALRTDGVEAFPSTVGFIHDLHAEGVRTAVISASENCEGVLAAAGVTDLFEVRVDGLDAATLGFPGKPDPAVFQEAARRLGVDARRAVVVEDAIAGVEAGRAGEFGLVIGIDRTGHPDDLARFADIVVPDLASLTIDETGIHPVRAPGTARRRARLDLPSALTDPGIHRRLHGRTPAVFVDYDGTLTPIVARPEQAILDPATRDVLRRLARRYTVGVISGRDLADVQRMVGVESLWFAGSHGLEIVSPAGERRDVDESDEILLRLDAAEVLLADAIGHIPEAWAERKRFAIAVHYRQTPQKWVPELESIVTQVAASSPGLRLGAGKMVFELRPDLDWDKGVALKWMVQNAGPSRGDVVPVYLGDDVTDEDGFGAIRDRGVAVVVGEGSETWADFRLANTDEVRQFLGRLDEIDSDAP
jgi:trehalose 6-phosphate phosphatase